MAIDDIKCLNPECKEMLNDYFARILFEDEEEEYEEIMIKLAQLYEA